MRIRFSFPLLVLTNRDHCSGLFRSVLKALRPQASLLLSPYYQFYSSMLSGHSFLTFSSSGTALRCSTSRFYSPDYSPPCSAIPVIGIIVRKACARCPQLRTGIQVDVVALDCVRHGGPGSVRFQGDIATAGDQAPHNVSPHNGCGCRFGHTE